MEDTYLTKAEKIVIYSFMAFNVALLMFVMLAGNVGAVGLNNPDIPLAESSSATIVFDNITSNYSLDSDKVDGYHASSFAKLYETNQFEEANTFLDDIYAKSRLYVGVSNQALLQFAGGQLVITTADTNDEIFFFGDGAINIDSRSITGVGGIDIDGAIASGSQLSAPTLYSTNTPLNRIFYSGGAGVLSSSADFNYSDSTLSVPYIYSNGSQLTDVCLSDGTNCIASGENHTEVILTKDNLQYTNDVNNSGVTGWVNTRAYYLDGDNGFYTRSVLGIHNIFSSASATNIYGNDLYGTRIEGYIINFSDDTGAVWVDDGKIFGNGSQLTDVCLSDGTNCMSSSGNPFNQELNTTQNVTFNMLNLTSSKTTNNNIGGAVTYYGEFAGGYVPAGTNVSWRAYGYDDDSDTFSPNYIEGSVITSAANKALYWDFAGVTGGYTKFRIVVYDDNLGYTYDYYYDESNKWVYYLGNEVVRDPVVITPTDTYDISYTLALNGIESELGRNLKIRGNIILEDNVSVGNPLYANEELSVKGTLAVETKGGSDNQFLSGYNTGGTLVASITEASTVNSGGMTFEGLRTGSGGMGVVFSGHTTSSTSGAIEFQASGGEIGSSLADLNYSGQADMMKWGKRLAVSPFIEYYLILYDDGNFTINGNLNLTKNLTINGYEGITGNYSVGECWNAYSGGILYATNCTSAS